MNITAEQMQMLLTGKLRVYLGLGQEDVRKPDMFRACALVLRDMMNTNVTMTGEEVREKERREVHYLSLEFLMGRSLEKNAYNLGVLEPMKEAVEAMGFHFSDLMESEPDAGLGNGGLGRLAACYLDSLTTLGIPATGYSICYELGIFKQKIINGEQVELADNWLEHGGDVWLTPHMDDVRRVRFGGKVEYEWRDGLSVPHYTDTADVYAVPMDMAITGYRTSFTNRLRLWRAKSTLPEDMKYYSSGEYLKAVESQATAEVISKVLYPEDNHYEGKSLRLKQQYFFVSATVQDIVDKHKRQYGNLDNFAEKHVIHINDTHPTLVIPELMRILMDEEAYPWDAAWTITTNTVAYTNHTVLAEALERWPQALFESLLPRIWDIVKEIAHRYQDELEKEYPWNRGKVAKMAIIWDGEVRMANLCMCACYAVNGVSKLHTQILEKEVFPDEYDRNPGQFHNVTNGIDHRRWLAECNPELHNLIVECIGDDKYLLEPDRLSELEKFQDDPSVLEKLAQIKKHNKEKFTDYVSLTSIYELNPDAIFDVQAKRLHEYKRQLLNVMNIVRIYLGLHDGSIKDMVPQTYLFAAKAAPGYATAKEIIKLINSLANTVNSDPVCKDRLQVVFCEDYRVSLAEKMIPAADISEQISTAGKEASGTGNMKFMMNGALTVGTLDGANVEMHERLGDDNIFLFGLKADEVENLKAQGYHPYDYYLNDPVLKSVLDKISHGFDDGIRYQDLVNGLLFGTGNADQYMLLADFASYADVHQKAVEQYRDQKLWQKKALINVAKSGFFAADRSVREYADEIWHVKMKR